MVDQQKSPIGRRAVAKGVAWSVPAVALATAAPTLAASLRKDPGLNGWVNNYYIAGTCGSTNSTIRVTSIESGVGPDGAPFGLYLYDTEDVEVIENASITYWVLGNHGMSGNTRISWSTRSGHSNCWSYQGRVGTSVKPDGKTYTGYRWTYTCGISPSNTTVGSDGVARVFLGNFHVQTGAFRQPQGVCGELDFWTERSVDIDGVTMTFQRRGGTSGAYSGRRAQMRRADDGVSPSDAGGGDQEATSGTAAS